MNKILSPLIFPPKKNNLLENNKLLFKELPFYGISGTIYRLEEAEDVYYKVIYNQDGTINPQKLPISKKKGKNYHLLENDYYKELEKCLKIFNNKYLEYANNSYKANLTNKQFYILSIATFLASVASIPFLLTTTWIGLVFATISVLSLYIVCDVHKKDLQNRNERSSFITQYKELERALSNYNLGNTTSNEKNTETTYTKIEGIDKSNMKIMPNIKILTNNGLKETA